MTLLAAMFPIYLMGNFHCLGMCGPIAMLLGHSPYRIFYLTGRLISFTLVGFIAGSFGEVLAISLKAYQIGELLSISLGTLMIILGAQVILNLKFPIKALESKFAPIQAKMHKLLYYNDPWPLFLIGFLTVALPCGQTLLVFSACALSESANTGAFNGFAFGLLTTPSLYLAMHAQKWIGRMKRLYKPIVGGASIAIGIIAILRGFAEMDLIPHFGIHPFMVY